MGVHSAITDPRQGSRYSVSHSVMAEHRTFGDVALVITNISNLGFMVEERAGIERGDRLLVRIPTVGHIECFCIWKMHQRAGFQFERPIRSDEFEPMVKTMQPEWLLRRV